MPELGKATYFLVANTEQFDAAMVHADELSAAQAGQFSKNATQVEAAAEKQAAVVSAAADKQAAATSRASVASVKQSRGFMGSLGALAVVGYLGFKQMKQFNLATGLIDQALKNAGATAGITRKQLDALTLSIFNHSKESKSAIMTSEALALSFHEIGDKARLVKDAVDASALTGRSLQTVTLALGRALENPTAGLTRLARAGISFSQAQIDMVKTIAKTQGAAAAQTAIFGLVEQRTKGMAEAARKHEPWRVLLRDFEELSRQLATKLVPVFQKVASFMEKHTTIAKLLVLALVGLAAAIVLVKVATLAASAAQATWLAITKTARAVMITYRAILLLTNGELRAAVIGFGAFATAETGATAATGRLAAAQALATKGMGALRGAISFIGGGAMLGLFAAGVGAYLLLKNAIDKTKAAQDRMDEAISHVGTKNAAALTYYATRVNALMGQGMDRASAKVAAQAQTFQHLGVTVGNKTITGIAQGITQGSTASTAAAAKAGKTAAQSFSDAMASGVYGQAAQLAAAATSATDQAVSAIQSKTDSKVQEVIDKMKARISTAKTGYTDAWRGLATAAMNAFDAVTQKGERSFDAALARFTTAVKTKLDAALSQLDAQGRALTPAEAALKALQDKRAADQRAQALADAQQQLAQAQTPADVASAKRAIANAQLDIQEAALQAQATAERTAEDAKIQAQKDALIKQAAAQDAAYKKQIEAQKRAYAEQRAAYKAHLEAWLKQEMAWLEKHPQMWAREMKKISAVLGPIAAMAGTTFLNEFHRAAQNAVVATQRLSAVEVAATRNFGRNLAIGIVNGLNETLSIDAYYAIVNSVLDALRKAQKTFQIKSPSRLTHDLLGVPLGQGVVTGFSAGAAPLGSLGFRMPRMPAPAYAGSGAPSLSRPTVATGSPSLGGRAGGFQYTQIIHRTDPDPFQLAHEAKFVADGVFG